MSHLSNSGEDAVVARLAGDGSEHCISYSDADVPLVYSIERCVAWVEKERFKKVWLQFPQDCCKDAPLVLLHMQERLPGTELVIIFNSSAKKCCVNLKNTHSRCGEGMIHFGRSCGISCCPIARLRVPAPCWLTNTERVGQAVLRLCAEYQLAEGTKNVVVLYDMRCAFAMGPVFEKLRASLPGLVMSKLLIFPTRQADAVSTSTLSDLAQRNAGRSDETSSYSSDPVAPRETKHIEEEPQSCPSTTPDACCTCSTSNILLSGSEECCTCPSDFSLGICRSCAICSFRDPKKLDDVPESFEHNQNNCDYFNVRINDVIFKLQGPVEKSDISFIYIGRKGPTLTSFSLKLANYAFHVVDPATGETFPSDAQKIVMQRSYKIEQIRDAHKIGLLISNFNVSASSEIVRRLAFFIRRSGKQFFLQYSAHPDLPKLMNVPGVDVFVHIACAESTVVERQIDPDLYKLVVTPWELEVALNPDREWSLSFETNFRELLSCTESQFDDKGFEDDMANANEYSVSVSLLSNKTQALGIAPACEVSSQVLNGETGALMADQCRQVAQRLEAGRHLGLLKGEMPWYGLDPSVKAPADIGTVVEGRKGVAGGYSEEGSC